MLFALEFPPVSHLLEWPDILFEDTPFAVNKVVLIFLAALVLTLVLFFVGRARSGWSRAGAQNVAESAVELHRGQRHHADDGPGGHGLPAVPPGAVLLRAVLQHLRGRCPFVQFPANTRMAMPMFLALMVWVIFNVVGHRRTRASATSRTSCSPRACRSRSTAARDADRVRVDVHRAALRLAVRLFANMLAGHFLLVTFAVLTAALWDTSPRS